MAGRDVDSACPPYSTGVLRICAPHPLFLAIVLLCLSPPAQGGAQEVRGRVLDSSTGDPVATAGVLLLDPAKSPVAMAVADSLGHFTLRIPETGSYYLVAERLGYFETLSPLLALSDTTRYDLDLDLRPAPVGIDGLRVTVRNEEMERWVTLRSQVGNPARFIGYRAIQGARLEEARLRAKDNTDFFRWLYIPVSHGRIVCVRIKGGCATIYVDDRWVPSELLETIDMRSVIAVVALPLETGPELHLFTSDFNWSVRRRQ